MFRIADYEIQSIHDEIDYTIPQSIKLTNVQTLWDKGYYEKGIHIAVLDTGIDVNHVCLKDRIVETKNFIDGTDDVTDRQGHGTHVAGIIAANRTPKGITGVAPESLLHIYKVLGDDGNGNMESIVKAIYHAIDMKVDIINMSLGGTSGNNALEVAIDKAIENNICVVCASGNDALGDDGSKDEINFPGFYREVIEIGSVNKDNKMSYFSNSNDNVDLVAYGGNIMACYPGNKYAECSGTSQATPQISGALALLKQKFIAEFGRLPECESELYAQLIKNTKTIPNVSRKLQGNGILYFIGE